ncbi:RrF2 family transcriptional regulator [candidate division KSB1 bacterium]
MLRLTKRSEYGIMAMKYIAERNSHSSCSAREIAEWFNIPPEILAKVMQKLVKKGLIDSHQGKNGGYTLSRESHHISVGDIILAIEDNISVVDCSTEKGLSCDQIGVCSIQNPMIKIHRDLTNYFSNISLEDLHDEEA